MPRTILIADDSSTIRRIVELTFQDSDIRVESVSSGAAALDRLHALRPDLVLADVVMPHPSGYEICRAVKSSDRPVPVLLLAGTFESFDSERAAECGADDHLVKPFEADALRSKVEQWLSGERPRAADDDRATARDAAGESSASEDTRAARAARVADTGPVPDAQLVEAVARAVVGRLSVDVLREVAREVVPELATRIIRERIRELESEE